MSAVYGIVINQIIYVWIPFYSEKNHIKIDKFGNWYEYDNIEEECIFCDDNPSAKLAIQCHILKNKLIEWGETDFILRPFLYNTSLSRVENEGLDLIFEGSSDASYAKLRIIKDYEKISKRSKICKDPETVHNLANKIKKEGKYRSSDMLVYASIVPEKEKIEPFITELFEWGKCHKKWIDAIVVASENAINEIAEKEKSKDNFITFVMFIFMALMAVIGIYLLWLLLKFLWHSHKFLVIFIVIGIVSWLYIKITE